MSARTRPLAMDEIATAFTGPAAEQFPPILSPSQLARLLSLSVKTIYEWIAKGRLDGAFRKPGSTF